MSKARSRREHFEVFFESVLAMHMRVNTISTNIPRIIAEYGVASSGCKAGHM